MDATLPLPALLFEKEKMAAARISLAQSV